MSENARSIVRTIAVFEAFAAARRPLSSSELVERLEAPRSSVADLLRTLVEQGVLAMDRRQATYLPTAKFARLGDWVGESWRSNHALTDSLARLVRDTGETASFAAPNDLEMEIVHVITVRNGIQWSAEVGQRYTAFGSAVGASHLATLPDTTIRSMYRRASRLPGTRGPKMSLTEVLALVQASRHEPIVFAHGALHPDVAAFGMALPLEIGPRPLYVGIGGPRDRFTERREAIHARLVQFLDEVRALQSEP